MPCEICGRNSCTRSFHSLEEQRDFDGVADDIKDRMKAVIVQQIIRLKYYESEETQANLVDIDEVISIIESYWYIGFSGFPEPGAPGSGFLTAKK